ncbi:MAG: hypothetical protein PHQ23_08925, partial [Candidatus Wallbacteria bacterium]|nr:hypothetical protein [Candidatus Wallbacteria bacterium]
MKSLLLLFSLLLFTISAYSNIRICKTEFYYTHGNKPYRTYQNVKVTLRESAGALDGEGKKPQPVYL